MPAQQKAEAVARNVMRLLSFMNFILIWVTSCAQTTKTFKIKEIGWTITLPSDFMLVDSITDIIDTVEGKKMLEDASGIKLGVADIKDRIRATKGETAHFDVTISKSSSSNFNYWDSINNIVVKILYKAMVSQLSTAKFDTLRTTDTIDGLNFKNFQMHIKLNDEVTVHSFYISKLYEGYTIAVNYYYIDESVGEEIKKMLQESKFEAALITPRN